MVTGGLVSSYLLDLGGATFQVASAWLAVAVCASLMAYYAYRTSRLMDRADPARRFWTAFGLAGAVWAAGEWAQVFAVAVDPTSAAAQTGTGLARTVALAAGCVMLSAAVLTYPIPRRSARERICYWLDLAILIMAAGTYGLYLTMSGVQLDRGNLIHELGAVAVGPMTAMLAAFAVGRLFMSGTSPFSWHVGVMAPIAAVVEGVARAVGPALARADQARWIFASALVAHALLLTVAWVQHQRYLLGPGMRRGARKRPYSRLPYFAVAATYGLLAVTLAVNGLDLRAWIALAGAIICNGLVMARQLVAFADNADLLAERDALATRLREIAFSDSLTGLANRAMFLDRLGEAMERVRRDGEISVLLVDLDDFKPVNDRFGHAAGDAVLVEVAARLRGCVRSTDVVARLGGDEFAVLLEQASPDGLSATAARIVRAIDAPCRVAGTEVRVGASVGVASARAENGDDAGALLQRADEAMYAAKVRGKGGFQIATAPAA
ncbi:GGDEF domain-containing protein [Planosporangium mesophilum]|uniref:GGDEF domain-containing protein n=1 Tax=Planosporangium mesophilum TaxID=689768 RepID=UPI0014399892|nr:GGDEF domain-containing protein [Planosporangium mesophilum]NJC84272.1 GGDEF domain-containing protein [Planosporangium mesophilum]